MVIIVSLVALAVLVSETSAGCCFPSTLEGIMYISEGILTGGAKPTGVAVQEIVNMSLTHGNSTGKMAMSFSASISNGTVVTGRLVQRFDKGIQYLVMGDTCKETQISNKWSPCIPDTAPEVAKSYMGNPANPVKLTSYEILVPQMTAYISVTNGCFPISETVHGKLSGVPFMETVFYVDLSETIKDPSVFDKPKECNSVQSLDMSQVPLKGRILRNLLSGL